MARFYLKPKAHEMRRAGKAINEICRVLGISKSTASLWCREINLTAEQRQSLTERRVAAGIIGRQMGAEANRMKKANARADAAKWAKHRISRLSNRDRLIAGIALYWAEGSKADSTNGFLFVNSDPSMIAFMSYWITEIIGISRTDLAPQVSINHIHREREDDVLNFWSRLLDLPRASFSKTFFAKTKQKKTYENHSAHYGVMRLRVRRGSVLRYKVLALIECLKKPG